jgi:hypothetical protein
MATHIGDVIVRDAVAGGYLILDVVTQEPLAGPYPSIADAALKAWQLCNGHVWREPVDARGRSLGPPFLLELQASSIRGG